MIIGIGTDVIEIERISGLMSEKFIKRILHPEEIKVLETFSHEARQVSFVAGRFAVKKRTQKLMVPALDSSSALMISAV